MDSLEGAAAGRYAMMGELEQRSLGLAALRLLASNHGLQVTHQELEGVLDRAAAGLGLAPAQVPPSSLSGHLLQLIHQCR